jgi:hypothetical protein
VKLEVTDCECKKSKKENDCECKKSEAVSRKEPHFTLRSLVKFCWGLTLNLSHNKQQNEIGKNLKEKVFEFLCKDATSNIDLSFLSNLIMIMSKTMRNMAFARDAHVRTLDAYAREVAETKKFWNDLTELTSFSKQGLPVQILSFLGFGSAGTLETAAEDQAIPIITPFSQMIQNFPNFSTEQYLITSFILFGVLGVIFATVILKIIGYLYISYKRKKIEKIQDVYYKTSYKKDMADILYIFYIEAKELVRNYYDKSYVATKMDEFNGMTETALKRYILNSILPPSKIHWPEWQPRECIESNGKASEKEEV